MNIEQERAAFEAWAGVEYRHADKYTKRDYYMGLAAWKAGRAALQSQSVIDEDHLSIVLDVYDNAMQKAFDGREFQNPCKSGTPEHKAWEKGRKEGKKKRDAGLPNSIALQSQDRESDLANAAKALSNVFWSHPLDYDKLHACVVRLDHARRVEGEGK